VIFNIGEIDCREGILVALERDKYKSLEEGMETVINIFIGVLQELAKKRKFKIYVHPIVPVLNETRSHVLLFNGIYKRIVNQKLKDAVWLNFENEMLLPDQSDLLPAFKLDGTHMHPTYVSLIERCLNEQ
jgi:hypothetical protein